MLTMDALLYTLNFPPHKHLLHLTCRQLTNYISNQQSLLYLTCAAFLTATRYEYILKSIVLTEATAS